MTARIRNKPAFWHTPVESLPVEPHRYRYDGFNDEYRWNDDVAPTFTEWKAHVPYQPGQVVWCERWSRKDRKNIACKAIILDIFYDRENRDRTGDRREKYRIAWATAAGAWSGLFAFIHPGQIQRGYQLAGLAPDMPSRR